MGDRHDVKAAPRRPRPREGDDAGAGARCPFCHDAVALDGRVWVACERCLARHHLGCWNAAGRCATCGDARGIGPASGARARELEAAARRHRWEALVTIVVLVAAAAGALGWSLARWRAPPPPPDPAPALRRSLEVARGERARAVCALGLVRLGRADLADQVMGWEALDERARHRARFALGTFLLETRRRDLPRERVALREELERELPHAIDPPRD